MGSSAAQERIIKTASDLFFRQGYRATGINQVIAESGVAKATFYDHYPSKDELLVAYVREVSRKDIEDLRGVVATLRNPEERFFAPIKSLIPWLEDSNYRGCPFQNILAEAPPSEPRVQEIARQHRENLRALFRELSFELLQSRPELKQLTPEDLADTYVLLLEGALAVSAAYREPWPVLKAIQTLEGLLRPT